MKARGRLSVPPSKSVSNRYLNLALLAGRPIRIERLLQSEDTEAFLGAFRALGWTVSKDGEAVDLEPGSGPDGPPSSAEIWSGASGTMLRFATAALAALPGDWRLDGTRRLRERPLAPLIEALRTLGGRIECLGEEGHAPLRIRGGALRGASVALEAAESSQYASALVMAAAAGARPLRIELGSLVSEPYLVMTLEACKDFGATVRRSTEARGDALEVEPGLQPPDRARVEGDYSSACYWAAGAALQGERITLDDLRRDSLQGDKRLFEVLASMGLEVRWRDDSVDLIGSGAPLAAVDCDMSDIPDQVPTLAAIAPFAKGTTRIRNVAHLRHKESDRLAAMTEGLRAVGASVGEEADGLVIPGVWAEGIPPADAVTIEAHDDHRIAMSFALLGLRRQGVHIDEPGVVAKSYPRFWEDLDACFSASGPR